MSNVYEVVVNGYGNIYCGRDLFVAQTQFMIYQRFSLRNAGPAGGRSIILLCNDKPVQQHLVCAMCHCVVDRAVACCGWHWCLYHLKQHDAECDAEYGHTAYRAMVPELKCAV